MNEPAIRSYGKTYPDDIARCSGLPQGIGEYATPLCIDCARRLAPISGKMATMMRPDEKKGDCEYYIRAGDEQ